MSYLNPNTDTDFTWNFFDGGRSVLTYCVKCNKTNETLGFVDVEFNDDEDMTSPINYYAVPQEGDVKNCSTPDDANEWLVSAKDS